MNGARVDRRNREGLPFGNDLAISIIRKPNVLIKRLAKSISQKLGVRFVAPKHLTYVKTINHSIGMEVFPTKPKYGRALNPI